MSNLVCLRTFLTRAEANHAQSLLAAEGIPSMIMADDAGGLRPDVGLTTGGVRLLVRQSDAAQAAEVLAVPAEVR